MGDPLRSWNDPPPVGPGVVPWGPQARGPVPRPWPRVGGRTLDLFLQAILVLIAWAAFGETERPIAALTIAWATITLYELLCTAWFGGTPGKSVSGTKLVALDVSGRVPLAGALRRGATVGALTVIPVVGWLIWIVSTFTDALGRGVPDRAARTMVLPDHLSATITSRSLPGFADSVRPPRMSAYGRVGDLDVRIRARLRRLNDAPVLSVAIGLLALAASLPFATGTLILMSSGAWIVLFVVDETLRVARTGRTAGHELAGLVVVDARTGRRPGNGRSFVRALVLGLTAYVPVLWPVLGVSMIMVRWNDHGRALHDLAGRTVVVADLTLDPEVQRQRAMRMRIGQDG